MKLLSSKNYKIAKGEKFGYRTYILGLAPATLSGYNTCPKASLGCKLACLNTAGMAKFPQVQESRIKKSKFFFEDREAFMAQLVKEIESGVKSSIKNNLIPVFRLNGTSDIPWEKFRVKRKGVDFRNIMEAFPSIQFYDYTAIVGRSVPDNYHLTFSRKESNESDVSRAISLGMNVAVVFDKLPANWMERPVFVGDTSDLRFDDPKGVIVGLTAKGKAKKDNSGFVVKTA